jgi:dipeptidase D
MSALEGLEPSRVWAHFGELTRIARPPKEEDEAREHILAWAAQHNFETAVDDAGNAVVRVPAADGRESASIVVLQAHLDMVCERDPESPYDPREGRINVVLDGDWVAAEGTTLGADNGIGVAAAMAVAEDEALPHGPVELLLTVSEEEGLDGAKALEPALVAGRLLVNLDGTSDDAITVGCAGSVHTFTRLPLELEPTAVDQVTLDVNASGARGGHSGADIARGRINANKALGRVLSHVYERVPFRLVSLEGGVSRNAIPREARGTVTVSSRAETAFRQAAEEELVEIREQYTSTDELGLTIEPGAVASEAAGESTTGRALALVTALPSGVVAMSPDLPDAVETSTSLNVVQTDEGMLTLASMTRSANASALEDVVSAIQAVARLAGAQVELLRSYPPWRPDLTSGLVRAAERAFERVFEAKPGLTVVHGGLECAVIGGRLPGVEMISIGPEIVGPHAPGERVSIAGTQRFYQLLGALLDDLSR